jgi:hypothetical protein
MDLRLTAAGQALLGRAWAVVGRMNQPPALGLTPEEADQLNALLHRVLAATGNDAGSARPA